MQAQTRHSPLIVGDHYELAETVGLHYSAEHQEDLVAKAVFSAALLPMSGYAKPQDSNGNEHDLGRPSQAFSSFTEYHTRRPLQDPMYLQNSISGAVDSHVEPPSTAYDRQNDQLNYGSSAIYQPRATFEATTSTYHDLELRKAFQVSTYNPERGNQGARVYVYLESGSDLITATAPIAKLMFASRPVPAAWTRLEAGEQHACYKYSVYATAPAFSETGSSTSRIPLRLQIQDQSRLDASPIYIGDWLYEDGKQLEHPSSTQASRETKINDEAPDTPPSTRRIMALEQQTTQSQDYGSYAFPSASLAYPQRLDFSNMQRRYTVYGRSELLQNLRNELDTTGSQGVIGGGAASAQPVMRHSMGQTSTRNSSYEAGYGSSSNPQLTPAPSFQVSPTPSPIPANPRFVRSNRIPQPSPNTTSTSAGSSPDGRFNSLAALEIRGNLDAMGYNWIPEEWAVERRIVRFLMEQNGTTIRLYFKPLGADERSLPHEKNERRISCIYWEEEDDFYVTSVDTIHLLALLFGIGKDDTSEKNRIRRNLQNFRPETISKSKPDTASFFELIMSFENPKASKIKKDVKVFKWSLLKDALNKIVSKFVYFNSLLEDTPITDLYQSGDPSSILLPVQSKPNPNFRGARPAAGRGQASAAYAQTPESMTLSPPAVPHGLPGYPQSSPLQQTSAASLAHSYSVPALGSPYVPTHAFHSPYAPHPSPPDLSSAYTVSDIGRGTTSQAPTEDIITSPTDYYSRRPHPNAYYVGQYAPQGLSEATATLGLPGRASEDLSAYLSTGLASPGDAQ